MARPAELRYQLKSAVSVANAATENCDIDVYGLRRVWVIFRLNATTTTGDLVIGKARMFVPGETVLDIALLTPEVDDAVVAGGGNVQAVKRYYVGGLSKIRVGVTNNNAGSKTLDVWVIGERADT
jgi:hypothetical protein